MRRAGIFLLAAVVLGFPSGVAVLVALRVLLSAVLPDALALAIAVPVGLTAGTILAAAATVTLARQLDPAPPPPRPRRTPRGPGLQG